jgi:hypothetical protein
MKKRKEHSAWRIAKIKLAASNWQQAANMLEVGGALRLRLEAARGNIGMVFHYSSLGP